MLASPAPLIPPTRISACECLPIPANKRNAAGPNADHEGSGRDYYYADGGWFGMFAPARTPTDIVETLAREVRVAMQNRRSRIALRSLRRPWRLACRVPKFMANEFRSTADGAPRRLPCE